MENVVLREKQLEVSGMQFSIVRSLNKSIEYCGAINKLLMRISFFLLMTPTQIFCFISSLRILNDHAIQKL